MKRLELAVLVLVFIFFNCKEKQTRGEVRKEVTLEQAEETTAEAAGDIDFGEGSKKEFPEKVNMSLPPPPPPSAEAIADFQLEMKVFEELEERYPLVVKYELFGLLNMGLSEPDGNDNPVLIKLNETYELIQWCRDMMAKINFIIMKSGDMNWSQNWETTNKEIKYAAEQFKNIRTTLDSINNYISTKNSFKPLQIKVATIKRSLDLLQNKEDIKNLLNYDFENSKIQEKLYNNLKNIFSDDFPPIASQGYELMDEVHEILKNIDAQLEEQSSIQ